MSKMDNKRALDMFINLATEQSPSAIAYRALTKSMNPGNSFTIQEGVSDTSTPSVTGGSSGGTGGSQGLVMSKLSPSKKSRPKKGRKSMKDGGSAKPDFLDMDNDGNTTESMKSAVKQKRDNKMGGGEMLRMKDGGMVDATLDATSDRATNGNVCRGGGAALRGTKFRGVR